MTLQQLFGHLFNTFLIALNAKTQMASGVDKLHVHFMIALRHHDL